MKHEIDLESNEYEFFLFRLATQIENQLTLNTGMKTVSICLVEL